MNLEQRVGGKRETLAVELPERVTKNSRGLQGREWEGWVLMWGRLPRRGWCGWRPNNGGES